MTDSGERAFTEVPAAPGVPAYGVIELRAPAHREVLVIPVINEGERILGQLAALQAARLPVDVVIADGGSTDGSTDPARLAELGVTCLLRHRGRGRLSGQLRMAIAWALERHYDAVLTMDGNGKDDVDGVARIVAALHDGADFVQGSRFIPGGRHENTPWLRLLAITLVHAPISSLAARHRYTDTTNGFRGHRSSLLRDPRVAPLRDVFERYDLLAYLPVRAGRLGFTVREVPVRRSYPRGEPVPTKIHGLSGNMAVLGALMRAALGRLDP